MNERAAVQWNLEMRVVIVVWLLEYMASYRLVSHAIFSFLYVSPVLEKVFIGHLPNDEAFGRPDSRLQRQV